MVLAEAIDSSFLIVLLVVLLLLSVAAYLVGWFVLRVLSVKTSSFKSKVLLFIVSVLFVLGLLYLHFKITGQGIM